MNRKIRVVLIAVLGLMSSLPAYADIGVTDSCQDDVKELRKEIDRNKDDYTSESRKKANRQLTAAKTNRMSPTRCRKNILDARQELEKGKRDKKKKNKNKN